MMWSKKGGISELGHRTKGVYKLNKFGKPLISIVTVVFNAEKYLEDTIISILEQTYDNIELIIIDGNSTDSTHKIILKYENQIDYAIRENDLGIYDAMNKGVQLSNGEVVNFMNAGDLFFNKNVIKSIVEELEENVTIFFGDILIRYNGFTRYQLAGNPEDLWKGMPFSHQSVFVRKDYLKRNKFDLKYKIVADMDLLLKAYLDNVQFKKCNFVIADVLSGGVSDANRIKTVFSSFKVANKLLGSPKVKIYFTLLMLNTLFRVTIKKILPQLLIKKIILSKNDHF